MAITMNARTTEHLEALVLDPSRLADRTRLAKIHAAWAPANFAPPGDPTSNLAANRLVVGPRHGLTAQQEAAAALNEAKQTERFVSSSALYLASTEYQALLGLVLQLSPGTGWSTVVGELEDLPVAAAQARVAALS